MLEECKKLALTEATSSNPNPRLCQSFPKGQPKLWALIFPVFCCLRYCPHPRPSRWQPLRSNKEAQGTWLWFSHVDQWQQPRSNPCRRQTWSSHRSRFWLCPVRPFYAFDSIVYPSRPPGGAPSSTTSNQTGTRGAWTSSWRHRREPRWRARDRHLGWWRFIALGAIWNTEAQSVMFLPGRLPLPALCWAWLRPYPPHA